MACCWFLTKQSRSLLRTVLEIKDDLQEKKVKFYLKVLEAGKLLKEEELVKSVIWRHREVEKTLLLLREWDIRLDEELIRKEKISICQLIFFKHKNLKKILGVERNEGIQTLEKLRKEFEAFLKGQEKNKEMFSKQPSSNKDWFLSLGKLLFVSKVRFFFLLSALFFFPGKGKTLIYSSRCTMLIQQCGNLRHIF